jgi:hypothetical protein
MHTIDDVSAIGETVKAFFAGMHTGDTERLRVAFHPAANLFGYYWGTFASSLLATGWKRWKAAQSHPRVASLLTCGLWQST